MPALRRPTAASTNISLLLFHRFFSFLFSGFFTRSTKLSKNKHIENSADYLYTHNDIKCLSRKWCAGVNHRSAVMRARIRARIRARPAIASCMRNRQSADQNTMQWRIRLMLFRFDLTTNVKFKFPTVLWQQFNEQCRTLSERLFKPKIKRFTFYVKLLFLGATTRIVQPTKSYRQLFGYRKNWN